MLNPNIHALAAAIKLPHLVSVFDSGDPLAGLKARHQWVVWRLEQFEGDKKPRKMPYDPKTFQYANTMDAATWSTFDHASQIASIYSEFKPGFVFTLNDPYVFIDLDGCRNSETGQFDEETTRIFTSVFPNAATEVSQSGTGLHLIMRGDKTQFGNRRNKWEGRFEFYQSGRFIAIAGNAWQGNADTDHTAALQTFLPVREYDRDKREIEISRDLRWSGPENDQELLIRMFASDEKVSADRIAKLHTIIQRDPTNFVARVELQKIEKRVAFAALWRGDANVLQHFYPSPNGQPFDHSAADLSLMNKLAFWTGRDHERMIRLFGMSALGKRQKWLERAYYRNRTTSNSRAVCREVYRGTPQERRDKQRKENERIGEHMEFDTTAKMLTLEAMVESFYFVANAGSSGSVADASNLSAVSIAVARNQYAPSKTAVKFIDKRTMQEKEKIVPSLELWLSDGQRKQADYLTWNPNGALICEPPEKVGQSAFNSWHGIITPKYGDYFIANIEERQRLVHAWSDHLAYLIPNDSERHKFEQWVAHILQRPGDKVETGWCFIATQTGIGRNWLGTVLSKVLLGYVLNNAVLDSVLEGSYNGRMSRKLIMIIDEARAGMRGSNSWALAEKLKTMVNPEYREINEKFGLQWVERNVMRWLVFSNNWDALPIEQNDRRWNFVENPTVPKSTEHYQDLYDQTLNAHFIAAVWAHLTTLSLAGFNVGDRPIESNARARMLANLASEEELALREFKERWPAQVARWSKVEQFVRDRMPGKPINQTALKRNLAKASMIYVSERVGKSNERLVIVRDLQETDVMNNPQHWINVAIDAAAKFDFPQPGTTV